MTYNNAYILPFYHLLKVISFCCMESHFYVLFKIRKINLLLMIVFVSEQMYSIIPFIPFS